MIQMPQRKMGQPVKAAPKVFAVKAGVTRTGWKCGIYGPEGIGKSSLAALCPGADFADIEGSMEDLDVPKVQGVEDWVTLRGWIQSLTGGVHGIDSVTRAEDWAAQHVIKTKKSNDGSKALDSLEDFKYKAGLQFVTDEFKKLLGDIDAAKRRGASFIMIAHLKIAKVKNPDGSDFVRSEPRLINDDKASNMLQWVQFLDHLAFIDLDKSVEKGKATGSGLRTIYLDSSPHRISKCRGIPSEQFDYPLGDMTLWQRLGL